MTAPKPPPHRIAILYVRVDESLRHAVLIRAAEEDRPMAEIVKDAVRLYLRRPSGMTPKLLKARKFSRPLDEPMEQVPEIVP